MMCFYAAIRLNEVFVGSYSCQFYHLLCVHTMCAILCFSDVTPIIATSLMGGFLLCLLPIFILCLIRRRRRRMATSATSMALSLIIVILETLFNDNLYLYSAIHSGGNSVQTP